MKSIIKQIIKNWFPSKILQLMKVLNFKRTHSVASTSKLFDKNIEVKNIHTNDRCFLIATGSSTNQQDLKRLNSEIVIGVSGFFTHQDIDTINPTYYVLAPVFKYHSDDVDENNLINWLINMDKKLSDSVVMFVHIGEKKTLDENGIFRNKKIYWLNYKYWDESINIKDIDINEIPAIYSVSEAVISVALYLGFKDIYLLGFDHDWYNGEFVYFNKEEYMKYWGDIEKKEKRKQVDSEFQMRRHAQIFNKYKKLFALKQNIFNANANANSYVDTFPKVKYEEVINDRNS